MKIKTENYSGLILQELMEKDYNRYRPWLDNILENENDPGFYTNNDEERVTTRRSIVYSVLGIAQGNQTYFLSERVVEDVKFIKDPIKVIKLLDKLPQKRGTIIISKKEYIKYNIEGGWIYMIYMRTDPLVTGDINYDMFFCDTKSGEHFGGGNPLLVETLENILRALIYIFYSKETFKFIKPNQKVQGVGALRHTHTHNQTQVPLTFVDRRWNVTTIVGGHAVNGHFRLQRCGHGRNERRLVWVKEHHRGGHTRKSWNPKHKTI